MSLRKAGLVGLLAVVAFALPASAATVEELQAQVNALLAQLSALQGGSSTSASTGCYTFTQDLTDGSTGAEVTALQNYLATTGHFTVAATGYFGPITKAALAAWQSANGVMPAAGYWGPISRAKYNMLCTPVSGGGTGTGTGTGSTSGFFVGNDEGSLDVTGQISKYANEDVGEDQDDVVVLGVEVEADGADQMIERVTVVIDNPSKAAEDDLEDFIQDVSVWLDGEELGRMDVEDASYSRSDDEYTFRFVGLEGIVEDGDEVELLVAVSGPKSVNGDIEGEGWDVEIPDNGIRAASPNGVTESYDGDATTSFKVESFSSANNVELKAKRSSDSPVEQTVVGDSDDEFDAELLVFELEAEGSDIEVFSLEFDLSTDAAGGVGNLVSTLTLSCDGDEWTETGATTTVFEDLEFTIDEGDTMECVLSAEMLEISGLFLEGSTLDADLDVSETDAEDESGEAVTDLSGSANGYTQTFISEGLEVSDVSAKTPTLVFTADELGETSQGQFVIEFKLSANDTPVYIDRTVTATTTESNFTDGEGIVYYIDIDGADEYVESSAVLSCISGCGNSGDNSATDYYIEEGDTETYRLTVVLTGDDDPDPGNYRIWIRGINWATTDATADQFYTSNLGEDSDATTPWLFLNAL